MSRATVKLCLSTTGFGSQVTGHRARAHRHSQGMNTGTTGRDEPRSWSKQQQPRPSPFTAEMQLPDVQDGLREDQGVLNGVGYGPRQTNTQSAIAFQPQSYQSFSDFNREEQPPASLTSKQSLPPTESAAAFNSPFDPSTNELDALLACNDTTAYDNQFGMNLGFGDEHDWSDGAQLDLFNGFFFGGMNNGMAVYDETSIS